MTEDPETQGNTDREPADSTPEAAALEAEIERTREDLAQTVDQLAAKLDVKTRARQRIATVKDRTARQLRRLRDRATDADGRPTSGAVGAGAGVLAVAVAAVLVGVRRRHSSDLRGRRRH